MAIWHDVFFRSTFAQVEHARWLLRWLVPRAFAARVDWASLAPCAQSQCTPALRLHHLDLLFTARLRGSGLRVFFLIEHKSGPDSGLCRQLHRYVAHIQSEQPNAPAPIVVPVVVYHGARPMRSPAWRPRLRLPPRVAAALAAFDPRQRIVIDDLARVGEADLLARPLSPLGTLTLLCLRFLPRMTDDEALAALQQWGHIVREVARSRDGQAGIAAVSSYFLHQTDVPTEVLAAAVEAILQKPSGDSVMSTADKLIQKGKAEGRVEGRVEGKAEQLLLLLHKRFGQATERVTARVRAAAPADLDRWALAVLDAATIEDVFRNA